MSKGINIPKVELFNVIQESILLHQNHYLAKCNPELTNF